MKKLILALALLISASRIPAQGTGGQSSIGGNILATSANCATAQSCVVMGTVPSNAGSINVAVSGTFSGTLVAEISLDGGATWNASATAVTTPGLTTFSAGAISSFRVRCSAYTSGNAGITITAGAGGGGGGGGTGGNVTLANNGAVTGNSMWVNAGEAVFANVSGNLTAVPHLFTVKFQPSSGGPAQITQVTANLTAGPNLGEASTQPYVAFATSGWLLSASVYPNATGVATGQAFGQLILGCANQALSGSGTVPIATFGGCTLLQLLAIGNMSSFEAVTWPYQSLPPTAVGPGYPNTIAVSNPAAGANWNTTITQLVRTKIIGIQYTVTTSATVANRYAGIFFQCNGTNTFFPSFSGVAQTANTTVLYSWIPGAGAVSGDGTDQILPFPSMGVDLAPGDSCGGNNLLFSFVRNLQAGDQISAIAIRELIWEESN